MSINKLADIRALYKAIEDDCVTGNRINKRFPVRFILLRSYRDLRNLVTFLVKKGVKQIGLADCLEEDNIWPTTAEICDIIKGQTQNIILTGCSEYLRFLSSDEFYNLTKSLSEIETPYNYDYRIYIPLVGISERFLQEFWNKFFRKDEWPDVWQVESALDIEKTIIFQLQMDLPSELIPNDVVKITSIKEWLNIWKKENLSRCISVNPVLSAKCERFLPDSLFSLEQINNYPKFLRYMYGFNLNEPTQNSDIHEDIMIPLIKELKKCKCSDLQCVFLTRFNIGSIEYVDWDDLLTKYFRCETSYERWLIWQIVLTESKFQGTYLQFCFKDLQELSCDALIRNIWHGILVKNISHTYLDQRRSYLKFIYESNLQAIQSAELYAKDIVDSISFLSPEEQLEYLTDITCIEKQHIIKVLQNNSNKFDELIGIVKTIYPCLYYYLDWTTLKSDDVKVNEWVIEYFKFYNRSKVMNCKLDTIEQLLNKYNKHKDSLAEWYYAIEKKRYGLIKGVKVVGVDGLGAEWLPLLLYLIENLGATKGYSVKDVSITRAYLPTTTRCNKHEQINYIDKLDSYIHQKHSYQYPIDLVEEIELIKKIIAEIINNSAENIEIISDHGFSFM